MQLTYYGANSWLLEFESLRILIDPWLVDCLTFGGQSWLFEGRHRQAIALPEGIDAILLSQGLDDHAHRPTLARLDKDIPVIASPSAAAVVQELGYLNVTPLKPGETHRLGQRLKLLATAGAPVPQVENGYLIEGLTSGQSLYYEPHGYGDPRLADYAPVDVVITPIVDLALPLAGAIIRGNGRTVDLLADLQASYILPTAAGGDIEYSGILDRFLRVKGGGEAFRSLLQAQGLTTELVEPLDQQAIAL